MTEASDIPVIGVGEATIVHLKKRLYIWHVFLACFYASWLWLVFVAGQWSIVKDHWPIALTMLFGSYVAGSTPMGGGTVGFPILVLLLDLPPSLGRDFALAVQSIGMTSASIFILARRQPLAVSMLKGAALGSAVGTPLGILYIAPLIPELWIKLTFAVVWASFGLLHLYRIGEIAGHSGMTDFDEHWDFRLGIVVGAFAGATASSVTGVGIDMAVYAALVLLCRADLKIAIPTSVVIMAFTSLVGVLVKLLTAGLQPGVYANWLAAAPVVALGAPIGVFVVAQVGRKPTLLLVAVLCVGQYIWTCYAAWESLRLSGLLISLVLVAVLLWVFEKLRAWGAVLAGDTQVRTAISITHPPTVSGIPRARPLKQSAPDEQ